MFDRGRCHKVRRQGPEQAVITRYYMLSRRSIARLLEICVEVEHLLITTTREPWAGTSSLPQHIAALIGALASPHACSQSHDKLWRLAFCQAVLVRSSFQDRKTTKHPSELNTSNTYSMGCMYGLSLPLRRSSHSCPLRGAEKRHTQA